MKYLWIKSSVIGAEGKVYTVVQNCQLMDRMPTSLRFIQKPSAGN